MATAVGMNVILILVLRFWTELNLQCMADGSFSGMDYSPLYKLILWWFWPDSGPFSSLHYTECTNSCGMTCGVPMVINREESLKMFLEPFSKCSWGFTKVVIFTGHPSMLVPIYHPTFLGDGVFIPGDYHEVFDSTTSFEVYLSSLFSTDIVEIFT